MNKDKKIEKIYKKISNKEISVWCRIKSLSINNTFTIAWVSYKKPFVITYRKGLPNIIYLDDNKWDYEIIWHKIMIGDLFEYFRKYELWEGECKCWWKIYTHEHEDIFCITGRKETMCDNEKCILTEDEINYQDKFLHIKNDMCFWPEHWGDFTKPIEEQSDECINCVFDLLT